MAKIVNVLLKQGMSTIMQYVQEDITIRTYTIVRDTNDDTTKQYTPTSVTPTNAVAYLEPVSESYSDERFGEVNIGDMLCYLGSDYSITDPTRTEVYAHNKHWKLVDTQEYKPNGQLVYTVCLLRKYDSRT
jgi:hypothetical protein